MSFPKKTMCRVQRAQTGIFSPSFGRTELIIVSSRAKKCEDFDSEVRLPVQPPKLDQKGVERFPRPKNLADFFCCSPKIELMGIV